MPASRSKNDRSKPKTITFHPNLSSLASGDATDLLDRRMLDYGQSNHGSRRCAVAWLEDYRDRTRPSMGRRAAVVATRAERVAAAKGCA